MTLYAWDEISCEIIAAPERYPGGIADVEDSGWKLVQWFDNEVRIFVSDRNHVALEVDADTPEQAAEMFYEASSFYRAFVDDEPDAA